MAQAPGGAPPATLAPAAAPAALPPPSATPNDAAITDPLFLLNTGRELFPRGQL
ncbi:MAG: hypothetical protein V9G23_02915 [Giesbergeria sp.]